jgi:KDO2-lipid IV(A) lauroyltransferase
MLAKRTGAVVLPVLNTREPDGRWTLEVRPPIDWEANEDPAFEIALNTSRYAAAQEAVILAHPEQWLWSHRRFKGDLSTLRDTEWTEKRVRS